MDISMEKIASILIAVSAATENGKLVWASDIYGSADFYACTARNRITLRRMQSGPFDDWDYYLGVCKLTETTPMEEFSDLEVKKHIPDAYSIFENLYQQAKWQSIGLDLEINNILQDL